MPATSEAALARKAARKRQRDNENYANNKRGRKDKVKARETKARDVQTWTIGVGHLGYDDNDKSLGARFDSREQYRTFVKAIFAVAKFVKDTTIRLKQEERAAAEEAERSNTEDKSEASTPTSTTSMDEGDEETETEEDDEEEDTDDETIDRSNPQTPREAALVMWDMIHNDEVDVDTVRMYWDVTLLESKNDLNYLCKAHEAVSRDHMLTAITAFCEFAFPPSGDHNTKLSPNVMEPSMVHFEPVKSMHGQLRYFMYGYSDDAHKDYSDCDKTPLFGPGNVEVPASIFDELIYNAIAQMEFNQYAKFKEWPWFKHSVLKYKIKGRRYNEAVSDYQAEIACEVRSDPSIRLAKLERYAIAPVITDIISELLAFHHLDERQLRLDMRRLLGHVTSSKTQLLFLGQSGSGKSRFCEPLISTGAYTHGLLNAADTPKDTKTVFAWEDFAAKDLDVCVCRELQKSLKEGHFTEESICDFVENSGTMKCRVHGAKVPTTRPTRNLPWIMMTQRLYFETAKRTTVDYESIRNRLFVVHFAGGAVPQRDHEWEITPEMMSAWLARDTPEEYEAPERILGQMYGEVDDDAFHFYKACFLPNGAPRPPPESMEDEF